MRFKIVFQKHEHGYTEELEFFAFLPVVIKDYNDNYEVRWLERVVLQRMYCSIVKNSGRTKNYWKNLKFLN